MRRRGTSRRQVTIEDRTEQATRLLTTDSGMHLLWDRAYFSGITDFDTWEPELYQDADIRRHLEAGHLVPINIHSDGAFVFTVRASVNETPELSEQEAARVLVASQAYRFESQEHLDVSGIEHVCEEPEARSVLSVEIPPGRYAVRVYLLDWEDLAERTDANPDFVLLVGLAEAEESKFRTSLDTFDHPPVQRRHET
jgi:hypothetical protein